MSPSLPLSVANGSAGHLGHHAQLHQLSQTADQTFTVGSGGDFATLSAALQSVSQWRPSFVNGGQTLEISLLSGFALAEQIHIKGIDLGFITITSVAATVSITRSALTTLYDTKYPAFYVEHAIAPIFGCIFNMDTSGTATDRVGIQTRQGIVYFTSGQTAGVINAGARGLNAQHTSLVFASSTVWSGAGDYGIRVANGASVFAEGADVSGAGIGGLHASAADVVQAQQLDATDCGTNGIFCQGSVVYADDADVSGSPNGVFAERGAIVSAPNLVAVGCDKAIWASEGSIVSAPSESGAGSTNLANATTNAVLAESGATVVVTDATMTGCGGTAVAANAATVSAQTSDVGSYTTFGFYAYNGGFIDATSASAVGAGTIAVRAEEMGEVNARSITGTGATSRGAYATEGGVISINDGNVQMGGAPAADDIDVDEGGVIHAQGATGGLGQAANTVLPAGIIWQV